MIKYWITCQLRWSKMLYVVSTKNEITDEKRSANATNSHISTFIPYSKWETVHLTSPNILNKDDLPHPLGPHTRTLVPDFTSNVRLSMSTSPLGVTNGTSSKRIILSWKMIRPAPGTHFLDDVVPADT